MNKKINILLKTLFILMLVTIIEISSVEASLQIVTVDVVPDNAGYVSVWKNYPNEWMGTVTTTKNFDFDTNDKISIVPSDSIISDYKFVRQCDHIECISGIYYGDIYKDLLTYKVTVYYEIPTDKESPVIDLINIGTLTPNVGDTINVRVEARDNVGVVSIFVNNRIKLTNVGGNVWNGKEIAREGNNEIGVIVCDAVKNCVQDGVEYNGTRSSTPTTSLHIVSLKLSSTTENSITTKVTTTGSGSLGIDLDSKPLVSTINVIKDGESETQLTTTPGEHLICAHDVNNNKEIKCESIDVKLKTTPKPTSVSIATSTTTNITPTPTLTTEKLKTSSDQPKLDDGSLFIDSDPSNAEIYLNDKSYGKTPKIIDIQPGGYILRVTKDGYEDYTKKVIVSESKTEEIIVKLIVDESINQSNQSAMNNGNSKQNNGDFTTSLINNMLLLAAVVVIAATAIICVIVYSRKNTYITYMSPQQSTNEKSMIVLKRADDHR